MFISFIRRKITMVELQMSYIVYATKFNA